MEQEGALSLGLAALCDEARRNAWSEGTRASYATGWNQWSIYCGVVNANPNCIERDGAPMSLPRTIELVTNYVAVQCGVRRLAPDASVKGVYLPAVAARFKEHRVVNNFGLAVK